jgi:DNA-binding PadR family transcriptional regulator
MQRPASRLEYALLGLVGHAASSGYDLRKVFATTPMASFSDSPGAIYPALKRLEEGGLLRGRVESTGLRQRKVFALTAAGRSQLARWLARPVTREDVVSGMEETILRFAFLEAACGRAAAARFLEMLESQLEAYVPELRAFLAATGPDMPRSAALALEFGVRSYESHLKWCRHARTAYQTKKRKG